VLVAEDQPQLRALMQHGLAERGYRVLEAGDGREALDIAARHDGPIHLLLTDVVMPNMGGQELAERLLLARPSTRVLFISGYSDDAIWLNGVFGPQSAFLQKPVEPDVLARKIRDALDGESLVGNR
jgi:CheY-like chemotaxis protein